MEIKKNYGVIDGEERWKRELHLYRILNNTKKDYQENAYSGRQIHTQQLGFAWKAHMSNNFIL